MFSVWRRRKKKTKIIKQHNNERNIQNNKLAELWKSQMKCYAKQPKQREITLEVLKSHDSPERWKLRAVEYAGYLIIILLLATISTYAEEL